MYHIYKYIHGQVLHSPFTVKWSRSNSQFNWIAIHYYISLSRIVVIEMATEMLIMMMMMIDDMIHRYSYWIFYLPLLWLLLPLFWSHVVRLTEIIHFDCRRYLLKKMYRAIFPLEVEQNKIIEILLMKLLAVRRDFDSFKNQLQLKWLRSKFICNDLTKAVRASYNQSRRLTDRSSFFVRSIRHTNVSLQYAIDKTSIASHSLTHHHHRRHNISLALLLQVRIEMKKLVHSLTVFMWRI